MSFCFQPPGQVGLIANVKLHLLYRFDGWMLGLWVEIISTPRPSMIRVVQFFFLGREYSDFIGGFVVQPKL